jgi:hypothetical protein
VLLELLEVGEHLLDLARPGTTCTSRMMDDRVKPGALAAEHREQVLREHEPDDVVDRVVVHG